MAIRGVHRRWFPWCAEASTLGAATGLRLELATGVAAPESIPASSESALAAGTHFKTKEIFVKLKTKAGHNGNENAHYCSAQSKLV